MPIVLLERWSHRVLIQWSKEASHQIPHACHPLHTTAQQTQVTLIWYVPPAGLHWALILPNISGYLHHLGGLHLTLFLSLSWGFVRETLSTVYTSSPVWISDTAWTKRYPYHRHRDCGYCNTSLLQPLVARLAFIFVCVCACVVVVVWKCPCEYRYLQIICGQITLDLELQGVMHGHPTWLL